jgi:hypothetical protein
MPRMSFSRRIKRGWATAACRWVAIVMLAVAPATAQAAKPEEEHDVYDARIEGYASSRTLPAGGNALTWIAFVVLAVIACAGLFKDAKRTHLD